MAEKVALVNDTFPDPKSPSRIRRGPRWHFCKNYKFTCGHEIQIFKTLKLFCAKIVFVKISQKLRKNFTTFSKNDFTRKTARRHQKIIKF